MMTDSRIQNRAFDEMRKSALQRLAGKDPGMIAENTGITYDREKNVFSLKSLGKEIEVHYPGYEITPELNEWHHLLLLHYLDMADGAELEGELMTLAICLAEWPGEAVLTGRVREYWASGWKTGTLRRSERHVRCLAGK